jgi:DNA repair protein RadC
LAVFQIARRFATKALRPGDRFTSSAEVFRHYHERLRDRRKEVFLALLLDSKNRVLREVQVSEGSLTASIVHPREVFAPVVRESAAAVLFIHNHPSGDPTPSREDLEITSRLREAGELMGVRVLDHIIIGSGDYVSLADRGLLG